MFALSNPNFLYEKGFSFFAWVMYVPLFFCIKRSSIKTSWIFGGIFAIFAYSLYAFWLARYDSLAFFVSLLTYIVYYAILFVLLKLTDKLFKRTAFLVQSLLLSGFDFLRTLGFAGFHYGIAAYTQWQRLLLIQIADVGGVFLLNFLVIFSSAMIFDCLLHRSELLKKDFKAFFPSFVTVFCFFCAIFFVILYGKSRIKDYSSYNTVRIAAIQHNENPNFSGIEEYKKNTDALIRLSKAALSASPDIIVWPETAVVPAVVYRYNFPSDKRRFELVTSVLDFIDSTECAFVIGNGHSVADKSGRIQESFNSALLFSPRQNVIPPNPEVYAKKHLVPLSEYFPFEKQFPFMYKKLLLNGSDFWTPGKDTVCFFAKGLYFSTPICFEDTFPDGCNDMVRKGARCFVNLSNDAWSQSASCQYQHLAMAVFRSVENRVPSVRSTASGQTCSISANGELLSMAEPFCQSYIICDVPVLTDFSFTPYNRLSEKAGEFFGYLPLVLYFSLLIIQVILAIIKEKKGKQHLWQKKSTKKRTLRS